MAVEVVVIAPIYPLLCGVSIFSDSVKIFKQNRNVICCTRLTYRSRNDIWCFYSILIDICWEKIENTENINVPKSFKNIIGNDVYFYNFVSLELIFDYEIKCEINFKNVYRWRHIQSLKVEDKFCYRMLWRKYFVISFQKRKVNTKSIRNGRDFYSEMKEVLHKYLKQLDSMFEGMTNNYLRKFPLE